MRLDSECRKSNGADARVRGTRWCDARAIHLSRVQSLSHDCPLDDLVARHHGDLMQSLRRRVRSREAAEDLTQETYLRLARMAGSRQHPGPVVLPVRHRGASRHRSPAPVGACGGRGAYFRGNTASPIPRLHRRSAPPPRKRSRSCKRPSARSTPWRAEGSSPAASKARRAARGGSIGSGLIAVPWRIGSVRRRGLCDLHTRGMCFDGWSNGRASRFGRQRYLPYRRV